MASLALNRRIPLVLGTTLAALVCSYLAGTRPGMAFALAGGAIVLALAFSFPVATLTLILAVSLMVPYDWQKTHGFSAGGSASIVPIDVLLLAGLGWAAIALVNIAQQRVDGRLAAAAG